MVRFPITATLMSQLNPVKNIHCLSLFVKWQILERQISGWHAIHCQPQAQSLPVQHWICTTFLIPAHAEPSTERCAEGST